MKWKTAIEYELDGLKIHDFYNDQKSIHDEINVMFYYYVKV